MHYIYIVAIPAVIGGAMMMDNHCYSTEEAAEAELAKQRQQGITESKVVLLYVQDD